MIVQRINTQVPYDVIIGNDLIGEACERLKDKVKKVVIVWDEEISSLYVAEIGNALEAAGKEVIVISVEGGEGAKTIETYEKIMKILTEFNPDRSDVIFGIGGGTVADLAGFVASTFKRGIDLVQMPTTLLAACDASVGGKNALNLGDAKNVIGTFYQPYLVLIDTRFFESISDEVFSEGCAEVIKMAYLGDSEMVDMLEERSLLENKNDEEYVSEILRRCIKIKAEYVEKDERDNGLRNILNLGHTLGHAIEAESKYEIHHGRAVAMGMVLITRVAENKGFAEPGTLGRMISILTSHGLEWRCPYNINALIGHVEKDKKVRDGMITLIIPETAGVCCLKKIPVDKLKTWLQD